MNDNKWTIIYTYHDQPIHSKYIIKSNPDSNILLANISNTLDKKYAWRNNDKLIRDWLKINLSSITTNNVIIAEWDTLISKKMPNFYVDGVYAKYIRHYKYYSHWYWFKDISQLENLQEYACGLLSFGFLILNIQSINILIDKTFDYLYDKDIFCELRLGTIFNYSQIPMHEIILQNILEGQKTLDKSKISELNDYYHPVKYKF